MSLTVPTLFPCTSYCYTYTSNVKRHQNAPFMFIEKTPRRVPYRSPSPPSTAAAHAAAKGAGRRTSPLARVVIGAERVAIQHDRVPRQRPFVGRVGPPLHLPRPNELHKDKSDKQRETEGECPSPKKAPDFDDVRPSSILRTCGYRPCSLPSRKSRSWLYVLKAAATGSIWMRIDDPPCIRRGE